MVMIVHYIIFVAFGAAGGLRGKFFSQEWMEKEFGKEHEEATGMKIGRGGYPDCGSGRYTMRAGYATWMQFAGAQRIHGNYLESVS